MCREPDGLLWDTVSYGKHIKISERSWDRSWARRASEDRGSASQFNPRISREELKRIELDCARGLIGGAIAEFENSGSFYYEHNETIGVSKGEFTRFLIVYKSADGRVHGFPAPHSDIQAKQKIAPRSGARNKMLIEFDELPVGAEIANYLHENLDSEELHQDLVTINLQTGYSIYVGWFPEFDPHGEFWIRAVWDTGETPPIRTKSIANVQQAVNAMLKYYSSNNIARTASTAASQIPEVCCT